MTSKILFIQLGCSKNRVDGEVMIGALTLAGHLMVDNENEADVIIINTCGFIEDAKKEAIEEILNAVSYNKKVIVTGCLAQRYKDEIMENFPELYGVIGVFDIDKIVDAVNSAVKNERVTYFESTELLNADLNNRVLTTPFYYSYLKIADGCSNYCSYCTIPKIRGKYISRTIEELAEEAKILAGSGVSELIVIAQDTSRYGIDIYKEKMIVPLLRELEKIDGFVWIRLHYLYPEAVTSELIDYIRDSKKVVPYFDIPLQHINDRILKLMNRRTTKKEILGMLAEIREKIPHAVIRTSLISGFPTETVDEHNQLKAFVKKGYIDRLGVFAFSSEEGTKAAKIKGKISKSIKNKRRDEIMELAKAVSLSKNKKKKNTSCVVLIEGYDTVNKVWFGRSYMDSPEIDGTIYFKSLENHEFGDYVTVKITACDAYDLAGEHQ